MANKEATLKLAFEFDSDDAAFIEKIKQQLSGSIGKVSNITAVRWAIRKAANGTTQTEG